MFLICLIKITYKLDGTGKIMYNLNYKIAYTIIWTVLNVKISKFGL